MTNHSFHPEAPLGPVHLTVAELERARQFYVEVLGFFEAEARERTLALGTEEGTPLVVLEEQPGARRKPAHTTGLYHYAVRVPDRVALARTLVSLAQRRYPLQGASDHLVSEAIYLADPDGHGIEVYADRPRSQWYRNGQLQMATLPLDIENLFGVLDGATMVTGGMPAGTRIGHVHLHVADLEATHRFYHELLGFDLMLRYGGSALFYSVEGYHHHIGANTWAGQGAPPPDPNGVGLRHFVLHLLDETMLAPLASRLQAFDYPFERRADGLFLRDPSQIGILVTAAPNSTPELLRSETMGTPALRLTLPKRHGEKPRTTPTNPHQQLNQCAPTALQEQLFERARALPNVRIGRSGISVPGARAFHLSQDVAAGPPEAFMIGREFGHLHPPYDGSLHLALPLETAEHVIAQGWGELHPVARSGLIPRTVLMVYGPRNEEELEVVWRILQLSHAFASGAVES